MGANTAATSNSGASLTAATETVIATLGPLTEDQVQADGYQLDGNIFITGSATAGTLTLRIRQTSVTGTVVLASPALTMAASVVLNASISALDTSAFATTPQASTEPGKTQPDMPGFFAVPSTLYVLTATVTQTSGAWSAALEGTPANRVGDQASRS